ncbi:class I SAM-dependent DNA methyltransferase [Methylobacterium oryzihabitans]|uniref:Methyltransferase domain-containing protein n=1 Tax=Methylobacterium oryzihabitans TaxID=2499852 RepID=A0A437P709_9HYPH|nr:methyltransferase domain-containing protein [Methylobacterium oryzihabitans]RVU18053.1 methyltransferase domain-containing protein [Methylobacterium oryzihabitans]
MTLRSSGDLLADRRYAWAEAALAEDDFSAAADLAEQVLERAPAYGPAWILLGRARARLAGDDPARREAARDAFARALALDPGDALGAGLHLAELGEASGEALSPAYVRALFDGYAPRFERHLVEGLGYRGPEMIREVLHDLAARRGRPPRFGRALDLGCGTGLVGAAFAGLVDTLAGVDLSPAMLARARAGGAYDRLAVGDLVGFLEAEPAGAADLIVAADVFIYLRDLAPAFAAAARALAPGGLFAVTLQTHPGAGAVLGPDGRYAHGEDALHAAREAAGLAMAAMTEAAIRRQNGAGVPGRIVVLERGAEAVPA